ncbi:MAG: hypothetical protein ABI675_00020 [Chitinophagaceae bacterium]
MSEQIVPLTTNISFKEFLFKTKRNRTILLLGGVAVVVQFAIFKYFYPYPSFIYGDSFAYLKAAYYNLDINTYMLGYSRFLRFFSVFTTSDTALVAFTYLLMQFSSLFLLFTLFYFYKPGKLVQATLLCFVIFSPLSLHLANLISSDGLFLCLSLIWFALLIWIIHRPSKQIIITHAIVLFIAFTVRYNALIYPFISILAFYISSMPLKQKWAGLCLGVLLCGSFVFYTSYKYKQLTGHWQYSPFSGWQLANNAMYAYKYVDSAQRKPVPKKFERLDLMARRYYDASRNEHPHPQEFVPASTIYMWTPFLPLWKYTDSLFRNDPKANEIKKWSSMGPMFKDYGIQIIRRYPLHFVRYFLWPNAQQYYAPPVEFLGQYNSGQDSAAMFAQVWFKYNGPKVYTRVKDNEVRILNFYPILSGLINVVMLCALVCYVALNGRKQKGNFRIGILMGGIMWLLNAGFTIFASSAALRFQSFPLMLTTIFTVYLLEWLWVVAFAKEAIAGQLVTTEGTIEKAMA